MAGSNPLVAEVTARDSAKGEFLLWRDIPMSITDITTSAGLVLTAGTAPSINNASSANFLRWAAGNTTAATFNVAVPGDYNEVFDKFHVLLLAVTSTTGDATMTLTGGLTYARTATTAVATSTVAPAPTITDSTSFQVVDLNFSGSTLKGKDMVTVTLTPGTHATDVLDVYGLMVRYSGGLSIYNATDNYATA